METPDRKTKQADEIFCWSCGEPIKKEAVICIRCGVQTRPLISQGNTASPFFGAQSFPASPTPSKNKTTAVLLAVFLSFWTWLYTFKTDKKKFIVCLALAILMPLLWGFFTIAAYEQGVAQGCFQGRNLMATAMPFAILTILDHFVFWLWAVIASSARSKNWYDSYPNG
jgi:hypothetical protein